MDVAEARQPRHALVEARVVLHRAGAQRKQAGIDAVVFLAETHVVAHRFRLTEARQRQRLTPCELAEPGSKAGRLIDVDARGVAAADLEDQAFFDGERAVAAEGVDGLRTGVHRRGRPALTVLHHKTSLSALA